MTLVSKQARRGADADSAQENKQTNKAPKPTPEGLPRGTDRVVKSIYLDTTLLNKLREIATRTNRSFQEVMREGLTLVVAKHAKGSARE